MPTDPRGRARNGARRQFAAFVAAALLVLVAVGTTTVLISDRIARDNALAEAERIAVRLADLIVAPLVREAVSGMPERWEELDRVLTNRLSDGSITSVVVWTDRGEVVYATIEQLIGRQEPPSDDLVAALGGVVVAHVDDEPETAYGDVQGPLLEVYVPIDVGAERMAVEAYFATDAVDEQAALLRGEIVPLAVGALVVLQLVQLPIAASLARRVRRQEAERLDLVTRSLAASDRERRSIAADVHDGPVQDLAGVSYALTALRSSVPDDRQPHVDRLVSTVRHAVTSLRRLMFDIYPPDLSPEGLVAALDDLAERLRSDGVDVEVRTEPLPEVGPEVAAVLYRTVKEALANVARHARADRAEVRLAPTGADGDRAVVLTVADDGVGVDDGYDAGAGHLGLRLVHDRVRDLGGTVSVEPGADGGTVLTALLPIPHGA
ncbi:sensor histidine kinase [Geodermatophilus sp. FMUSA9-8]|uniref:sensor histidine kinase n=1 Tax=Geodermatophilus sp. FMUSA9-8 TaxID=3120155 RepID=UPI00300AC407